MTCPMCGKDFAGRKHQKFCSAECCLRNRALNKKRKAIAEVVFKLEWAAWKRDFAQGKTTSNLEVSA